MTMFEFCFDRRLGADSSREVVTGMMTDLRWLEGGLW